MSDLDKEIIRKISQLERWKNELRLPETPSNDHVLRSRFLEYGTHMPGIIFFLDTGKLIKSGTNTFVVSTQNRVMSFSGSGSTGTIQETGFVQYVLLDGTSHHLSSSLSECNVLGNETPVSSNGLTLGAWVYFTSLSGEQGIIARWDANPTGTEEYQYRLYKTTSHTIGFDLSTSGTAADGSITSDVTVSANTWYFVAGIWDEGNNMSVTVNSTVKTAATVINAPLANKDSFNIGFYRGPAVNHFLAGRIAYPFVAISPISNTNLAKINTLFNTML